MIGRLQRHLPAIALAVLASSLSACGTSSTPIAPLGGGVSPSTAGPTTTPVATATTAASPTPVVATTGTPAPNATATSATAPTSSPVGAATATPVPIVTATPTVVVTPTPTAPTSTPTPLPTAVPTTAASSAPLAYACAGEPYGIGAGPDGALWFTESSADRIGRITTGGAYQFFSLPAQSTAGTGPGSSYAITAGADGALWATRVDTFGNSPAIDRIMTGGAVTETSVAMLNVYGLTSGPDGAIWFSGFEGVPENLDIGRITTDGNYSLSYFPDASGGEQNGTIATGSDGALWYTESFPNVVNHDVVAINRVTTAGAQSSYPTGATTAVTIAAGPDGALWFTGYTSASPEFTNTISRITTAGAITTYSLPAEVTSSGVINPNGLISTDDGITTGPDGALWFTDPESNSIGRITTAGAVTEYAVPTAQSDPQEIASGPDGALWFTEVGTDKIGRITTSGAVQEFPLLCATPNSHARHRPIGR